MKKIFIPALICTTIFFTSCSSDDDNNIIGGEDQINVPANYEF